MSSLALLMSTGGAILVDCGEGTQHQIRASSLLRASKIDAVMLTHLHGDHCFGLFGLLHTMAMDGRKHPVLLCGPEGIRQMVDTVLGLSGGWSAQESFELVFHEIPNGELVGEGFGAERKGFHPERCAQALPVHLGVRCGLTVQAVPLVHSAPDWGYVFTEPDRPGALDARRAVELGVPAGSPLLGKLKRGQPVLLEDGTEVCPSQVVADSVPGRTVAVLQDTCDASAAVVPCIGAACVIHEATFGEAMEVEAISKGHSTSAMAARFAATCGARRLVLTHFSARYGRMSEEAPDPAELLGEEARRSFNSPVVVAQDFMVLQGDKDFEPDRVLAMKRPRKRAGPSLCSACGQGQSELVV